MSIHNLHKTKLQYKFNKNGNRSEGIPDFLDKTPPPPPEIIRLIPKRQEKNKAQLTWLQAGTLAFIASSITGAVTVFNTATIWDKSQVQPKRDYAKSLEAIIQRNQTESTTNREQQIIDTANMVSKLFDSKRDVPLVISRDGSRTSVKLEIDSSDIGKFSPQRIQKLISPRYQLDFKIKEGSGGKVTILNIKKADQIINNTSVEGEIPNPKTKFAKK
jgi:hypothetical protein